MAKKLTQEQVIDQFNSVHGDRYDYSLVNYVNNRTKVSIICSIHGVFKQLPADHKAKIGCIKCGFLETKKKQSFSLEQILSEFIKVHGKRYDYSQVKYINSKTPVDIVCIKHGLFQQKPEYHKNGHGCPECGVEKNTECNRLTNNEIIKSFKKCHGNKYDYSRVNYINNSFPVEIICSLHGAFFQSPYSHKNGANCHQCAFSEKSRGSHYTLDRLINDFKAIHGDTYNYQKVKFERIDKLITILCKIHGEFKQLPYIHKQGSGCPTCAGQNLDTNKVIEQFIEAHGNKYDYSHVKYEGVTNKVKINCYKHGLFEQLPTSHKSGNGCPSCGEYGFDGSKSAILYYLKIDNGKAYKIGISNHTIEERFKKYELPIIEVINIWYFEKGNDARKQEQKILNDYLSFKYNGQPLLSSGNTELFNRDVLHLDGN